MPFADRLVFNRIGSLAAPPTEVSVHDLAKLRINNVGTETLQVAALNIAVRGSSARRRRFR